MANRKKTFLVFVLLIIGFVGACDREAVPGENDNGSIVDNGEVEPLVFVQQDAGYLQMRKDESDVWLSVLDLTLLTPEAVASTGEISYDDETVYWRLDDAGAFVPLIQKQALVLLAEGYFDREDVRLRVNVDRLEWYDDEVEAWALLFNFGLVHEDYVVAAFPENKQMRFSSIGSRMPLLETFGFYDGHTRYDGVLVADDTYDEARDLYLPMAGYGFNPDHIDFTTFENTEGNCQHPDQKCYGGVLNIELAAQGYALFEQSEPLDWDAEMTIVIEVSEMAADMNVILRLSDEGATIGTFQTAGSHTFTVDANGIRQLLIEVTGDQYDAIILESVEILDTQGETVIAYDASALKPWRIITGDAAVETDGVTGMKATFDYDNYHGKLGLIEQKMGNEQYDDLLEEYAEICGEKQPHPDDPDNEDMWIFTEACPVHSVTGKGDEIVIGDTIYFQYDLVVREYRMQGFDRLPYLFFGSQDHGLVRLADERIEAVILSDDMEKLPDGAFYGANRLMDVTLPEIMTVIGAGAFKYAGSLETIELPEGLTIIEREAFYGVRQLHTLDLPEGLAVIESGAFAFTENLTAVDLPDGLVTLGRMAFYASGIETVHLPESITSLSPSVFARANLKTVRLPENIAAIYTDAFLLNPDLKTVIIERDELVPILRLDYMPGWHENEWSHAFNATSEDLRIYVPASLVDAYREHPSWVDLAERIHALDESDE